MKRSEAENAAVAAVIPPMPLTRENVTHLIYAAKVRKGLRWGPVSPQGHVLARCAHCSSLTHARPVD